MILKKTNKRTFIKNKNKKPLIKEIYNAQNFEKVKYSKILAKEILITETFVNRVLKKTKRPVVVVGIGGTGVPYTWSIKPKEKIFLDFFNYPSTKHPDNMQKEIEKQFINFIKHNKQKIFKKTNQKPTFVFVDASTSSRMPSSFVGFKNYAYTQPEHSIKNILEKKFKTDVSVIGYDWSLKNKTKYLPKDESLTKEFILLNPAGKNSNHGFNAYHDDNLKYQTTEFKSFMLKKVNTLKKAMFKK